MNVSADLIAFGLPLPGAEVMLAASLQRPRRRAPDAVPAPRPPVRPDLLLMDRGYSSRWLVAAGNARGIAFCMRVDKAGFACVRDFLRSGDDERIVTPIQGDDHEESEVIYRYKLSNIADLARNPQVEEAFPVVRRTVDGEHTQKEELYVKLTPQGEALGLND